MLYIVVPAKLDVGMIYKPANTRMSQEVSKWLVNGL